MNITISNKYQHLLDNLDIDVMKKVSGEFTVRDIANQFKDFYFSKMVIDVTALKDYEEIATIQNLIMEFDSSKIILLLNDSPKVRSQKYISQLISMGIYNYTPDVNMIPYLIDHPNNYNDVAKYHILNPVNVNPFNEKSEKKAEMLETGKVTQRVIGIKNLTDHSGATTLTYLMKKHLSKYYKVKALEVNNHDFVFFGDKDLQSVNANEVQRTIYSLPDMEVILVDINDFNDATLFSDVIYLIEPGTIKLNKLVSRNRSIFKDLGDAKLVLNESLLSENDVATFEKECRHNVFFNIPSIDDKEDYIDIINTFLISLGFSRLDDSQKGGLFNIF